MRTNQKKIFLISYAKNLNRFVFSISLCVPFYLSLFFLFLHCLSSHFVECVNSFNPILIHITRIAIPFLALKFVECSSSNPIIYQPFCCCLFSFKVFHLCSFGAFISSFFFISKCDPGVGVDRFFHAVYTKRMTRVQMLLGSACSEVTESLAKVVPHWNIVQVSK